MSNPTVPFYPMTHDDAQELIAAIGDNSKLAEAYDATRTYTVNEHCIHSGKLYRCNTAITTAEGWNAEHWEEITVGEELTENSKGLAKLIPVISGSLNNSGYLISTGDYFEANGELYKATAAIPTGQPWGSSSTGVSASALNDAVSALNSNLNSLIVAESKDISNSDSIASGSTKRFDIPITKNGYTPLGIIGITGSNTTGLSVQEYLLANANTVAQVYMRNVIGSAITPTNISARILYLKNS